MDSGSKIASTAAVAKHWVTSVQSRQERNLKFFRVCAAMCAVLTLAVAITHGVDKLVRDLDVLLLIFLSVIATYPNVEVARRKIDRQTAGSIAPSTLTGEDWKETLLQSRARYNMLSSTEHPLRRVYVMLCVMNIIGYVLHVYVQTVPRDYLLTVLVLQAPFNPLGGHNPLAMLLLRPPESKMVEDIHVRNALAGRRNLRTTSLRSNNNFSRTNLRNADRQRTETQWNDITTPNSTRIVSGNLVGRNELYDDLE